jgi:pyruvate/2-oxoglutarate dehydrogenase complex dihydrolipoamide acyltransferase (E2) component
MSAGWYQYTYDFLFSVFLACHAHMSSSFRPSQSSVLLDSAVRRMEDLLSKDMAEAIVAYFRDLVDKVPQQDPEAFRAKLDAVAKLNTDDIHAAAKTISQAMSDEPAALEQQLEDLFVNRARIFSAARPDGGDSTEELEVAVPTIDVFVHRVLVLAAQRYRRVPQLFVDQVDWAGQDQRLAMASLAVREAMDKLQNPRTILRQQRKAAAAAAATDKKSVAAVSVKKAPSVHAASKKSAAPAPAAAPSVAVSVRDLGFVEEEEEEEPMPILPVAQPGGVQLLPQTQAQAQQQPPAPTAAAVPRSKPAPSALPAADAVSRISAPVRPVKKRV